MPIFEFTCRSCGRQFEQLVRPGDPAACPACQSQELDRLVSAFAAKSQDRSRSVFQAAKAKAARAKRDSTREELEHYYREHDHDHPQPDTK